MSGRPYNFAYLDEQTKRMIRRAILKAVAIPGYQVPFASREMPMPYGWGTGGVQVTAAILGPNDVLKVIDQGADDTTNAVSIRAFFAKTAGVATTTDTASATIIQTRHRVPEAPLTENQILVYQVPIPEPLRFLEPRETETRTMHALGEYGVMQVKLYEDIARHGHIATTYAYPVRVAGRLQIARNLVTSPRLVFMDEPTGGLDVSVQARLLDLIRGLIGEMGLAVALVTHDLAVARLLSNRIMVMKDGEVIESGLTDRVLDDPQAPYTQLLVSSVLAA
jgi:alpha-D-ribose 1-methylphosphonate 5-phosphate C-P lyase